MSSILNIISRVFQKKAAARPLDWVQVELTNHCTCRCMFCPQSTGGDAPGASGAFCREKGFMDTRLYREVIDFALQNAAVINFSFFGEPMLHPEFLLCMDRLKDRPPGVSVVMNTNLTMATRAIFSKLIEIGLDDLRLSIDATTPGTYDLIRSGARFVDLDGRDGQADRFQAVCGKAEYWLGLPGHTPTRHVFTVSSRNVHELKPYVLRWLPLLGDRDVILAKNVLTYGGQMQDDFIEPHPCNVWDSRGFTVDWQGNVSPCNLDVNMRLTIGNVLEDGLPALLESRRYDEVRSASLAKGVEPCLNCVDANNWSKNIIFRKGDAWRDAVARRYAAPAG